LKPVVIVGGGVSGLSAGVRLAERHLPVLVLEQRPSPGGRAYSFTDARTGDVIDNGQHVLIAGYAETLRFLKTIGTLDRLAIQPVPELLLHHPERGFCSLRFPRLPHPIDLLSGIARTRLLSLGGKADLLRAGRALNRFESTTLDELTSMTVAQWLDKCGQSTETKRSFWEPLAVAIMNEHTDTASASVFLNALRSAFFEGTENASLAIPTVGLNVLYVDEAKRWIEAHGGEVRCNAQAVNIATRGEQVTSVTLKGGKTVAARSLILAVPPAESFALLPRPLRETQALAEIAEAPYSPIVSVHLWFPVDFMPNRFIGVIGRTIHWVFNRRKILAENGEGGHVSAVVSAGDSIVGLDNDAIRRIALRDLRSVYGPAVPNPEHTVVIREKRATISCSPSVEKIRPGSATSVRNLFLAGDWTATGLPATLESAVVSGQRCADLALACGEEE
jgi:squalene-associated FAD-dependent desaturase